VDSPVTNNDDDHDFSHVLLSTMAESENERTLPLPLLRGRPYIAVGEAYTLRSLQEADIVAWARFCASAFAHKKPNPPPPSYFERHYWNDPNRQASDIRVATIKIPRRATTSIEGGISNDDDSREQIVASCRVFRRRIYASGIQVDVGGIGEVCTSTSHRRRGLSRELLNDCIAAMVEEGMALSFLHAAPAFFPVYESAGYAGTETSWTVIPYHILPPMAAMSEHSNASELHVRPARFPADTDQLSHHYRQLYSSLSGCLVRSDDYWANYLGEEWKDCFWVATTTLTTTKEMTDEYAVAEDAVGKEVVRGWLIARWRGLSENGSRRIQICDFGYDSSGGGSSAARYAFGALLLEASKELCRRTDDVSDSLLDVVLPTLVANVIAHSPSPDGLVDGLEWESSMVEYDRGWMYKALDDEGSQALLNELRTADHLMWPADSF
jgi:RimJ/RimL family protein N-acetyltransferase